MWARMPIQALVADVPLDEWQNLWKIIVSTMGL